MRVLDVGSGGGDTALLAAELVGEERRSRRLRPVAGRRRRRAGSGSSAAGKRNISFSQGDLDRLAFVEHFDAAVGRYVLMFNPDPAAMLKSVAHWVRPGGVIVFHEPDWKGIRSNPIASLYEQCHDWIVRTFKQARDESAYGP